MTDELYNKLKKAGIEINQIIYDPYITYDPFDDPKRHIELYEIKPISKVLDSGILTTESIEKITSTDDSHCIIIDNDGNVITSKYEPLQKHTYYNRFFAKSNGKIGIIEFHRDITGIYEKIIIPLRYDDMSPYQHHNFSSDKPAYHVRIGKSYGILYPDGHESHIKYNFLQKNSLDREKRYIIVTETISGYKGIFDIDTGIEILPCRFTNIDIDYFSNIAIVSKDGSPDNWPQKKDRHQMGCFNLISQKQILPCQYQDITYKDDYIFAGYNGQFYDTAMPHSIDDPFEQNIQFGGTRDVYNKEGELLLRGFSDIKQSLKYPDHKKVFYIYLGYGWRPRLWNDLNEEYETLHIISTDSNDRILAINEDGTTLLPDNKGEHFQLYKGYDCFNGMTKDLPFETLVQPNPFLSHGWVIEHDTKITHIKTGIRMFGYDKFTPISERIAFVSKGDYVGIVEIGNIDYVPCEYCLLTWPIDNFVIAIKQNDAKTSYEVHLLDISYPYLIDHGILCLEKSITSIQWNIERYCLMTTNLGHSLANIYFKNGNKFITNPIKDVLFSANEKLFKLFRYINSKLYYHGDLRTHYYSQVIPQPEDDYDDYWRTEKDETDYRRMSWDAMTDGMYGDYPNGGGDYDGIGF